MDYCIQKGKSGGNGMGVLQESGAEFLVPPVLDLPPMLAVLGAESAGIQSAKRQFSVMDQLAAPFCESVIRFKPAAFAGRRALALPYVDVCVIEDRLDGVLGPGNWQDEYKCLPGGSVTCRLKIRLDGEWITKMDVGSAADHMDEGDRRKAAFSDALKRAAVKFGIGATCTDWVANGLIMIRIRGNFSPDPNCNLIPPPDHCPDLSLP